MIACILFLEDFGSEIILALKGLGMHYMMEGSMMGAMGLIGLLSSIVLLLSIAALIKYLFLDKK